MFGCPVSGETVLYIIRAPAMQFLSAQHYGEIHFLGATNASPGNRYPGVPDEGYDRRFQRV